MERLTDTGALPSSEDNKAYVKYSATTRKRSKLRSGSISQSVNDWLQQMGAK